MTQKSAYYLPVLLLLLWGLSLFGYAISAFELTRFFFPLAWAFLWHVTCLAFGQSVLYFLGYRSTDMGTQFIWSWLTGLGLAGVCTFILLSCHLGQSFAFWSLWGAMGVLGAFGARSWLFAPGVSWQFPAHWRWFSVAGLVVLLFAAAPPLFYDTAVYHLGVVQQMGLWGETIHFPHSSFAAMPMLTEMAIGVPVWLSGDPVVFNIANGFGFLMMGFAVSSLARRSFTDADNSGLLLAVVACPLLLFVATGGKPDWMTATACVGSYFFWLEIVGHHEGDASSNGLWVIWGLMIGVMIGSKYHGLLCAISLAVVILACSDWRQVVFQRKLAWALLSSCASGGLYLIRNAFVFQNPVYPFGDGIFGASHWNERTSTLYGAIAEKVTSLSDMVTLPWKVSFWVTDGTMNDLIGPLWLFLLPLALVARPWPVPLKRFGFIVLVLLPLWMLSNAKVRYFAPLWLFAIWACGWGWAYLNSQPPWLRRVGRIGSALLVLCSLLWNLQADEALLVKRGRYVLGHQDKETYLKENYGPYEVYQFINERLSQDAQVWLLGEPRVAYLKRPAYFSDVFVKPLQDHWLSINDDADKLHSEVRDAGITHVIVSQKGLHQLRTQHGYGMWTEAQKRVWAQWIKTSTTLIYEKNNWQIFKVSQEE